MVTRRPTICRSLHTSCCAATIKLDSRRLSVPIRAVKSHAHISSHLLSSDIHVFRVN